MTSLMSAHENPIEASPGVVATPLVEPAKRSRQSWQRIPGRLSPVRSGWLLFRRLFAIGLVVVLIGIWLWLLLSLKRYVPMIVVFATGYELPLGPIPMAFEDRQMLRGLADAGGGFFQPRIVTWHEANQDLSGKGPGQFVASLVSQVAKTRPGGPRKDMAIVYLSMVGVVDAEGQACLLPPGISSPEVLTADAGSVRLSTLLRDLRAALPSNVGLLVVLDACHGHLQWPLGLADGVFPVAVQAACEAEDLGRTWVLLSASAGQVAQGETAAGSSPFAQFFALGLEGAADRRATGDGDGIVDLAELLSYLQAEVDRHAVAQYGVHQIPVVMPSLGSGLPPQLGWVRRSRLSRPKRLLRDTTPADNLSSSAEDWWLRERWLVAERLQPSATHHSPRLWQQYQRLLLRAEALRQSGSDGQRELGRTETLVERLETELGSLAIGDLEYLASLRLPQLVAPQPSTAEDAKLSAWVQQLETAVLRPSPKATPPSMQALAVGAWNRRARVAWEWLVGKVEAGVPFDQGRLRRWLEMVGNPGGAVAAEPTQIHTVRMLLSELDPSVFERAPQLPGQLLRLVGRSREACFAKDVRADQFVDLLAPRGDTDRNVRRAIDLAIVGDAASLDEAARLVDDANRSYDRIIDVGTIVSDSYRTADVLLDELPWLVAWWTRELGIAKGSGGTSSAAFMTSSMDSDGWEGLVDAVNLFIRTLAESPAVVIGLLRDGKQDQATLAAEILGRLEQQRDAVEARVAPLRDAYRSAVVELAESAADTAETLGQIRRILDTPLVRGAQRLQLLRRAEQIRRVVHRFDLPPLEKVAAAVTSSNESVLAAWTSWHGVFVHPLTPLLALDAEGMAGRPVQPAEIARSVGRQLAAIQQVVRELPEATRAIEAQVVRVEAEMSAMAPGFERTAKRLESLQALGGADFSWRRLSSVAVTDDVLARTTVRKSLLAAWHDRLLAAGSDALDDFWAASSPRLPVWCQAAARGFLEKAEEVIRAARIGYGDARRGLLQARLDQLQQAVGSVDGTGGFGSLVLDPRVIRLYDTSVLRDSPSSTARLIRANGVPDGLAALWFAETDSAKPLPLARGPDGSAVPRLPLAVASASDERVLTWAVAEAAAAAFRNDPRTGPESGRVLDAVAAFRGHRLVSAVPLARGSSLRLVEWLAPPATPPQIMVKGNVSRNRAVSIVFDCSGSMGQRLPDGRTRLEAGRAALYEVLETMARDGGWSVSVWLYGHRTRWSRDAQGRYTPGFTEAGKVAEKRVLAEGKPFQLLPGDDVEQVLTMQPLVPVQVALIRSLLDAQEPGGETPLYLAIDEAIRGDFGGGEPGPSHVLVVTDGANDQSGGRITTSSDVLRTLSQVNFRRTVEQQVRIDVIGFDLQPGGYDRQLRLQDLQSVAADSRGQYFDATDPLRLTGALRSSLQMLQWELKPANAADAQKAKLNEAIQVPFPIGGRATYDVSLEAQGSRARRISLIGGEAIELFVTGRGRGLEFRRYTGGTEQGLRDAAMNLPDPESSDRTWFIGAHLPSRRGSTVSFPISVQNGLSDAFSPKPVEMWVEVVPLGSQGPVGPPYLFTDLSFQQGRPVPVIDLVAQDWPQAATGAEIRPWFRFSAAEPEASVPVGSLVPGVERRLDVQAIPGVKVTARVAPVTSANELVLTVTEEYPTAAPDPGQRLRVGITAGCRRAVHVGIPEAGRVRHEFVIETVDGQVSSDVLLTLTDREAIRRDAIGPAVPGTPPRPLRVVVPTP